MPAERARLGLILIDGGFSRAHFAFSLAAGAAAMDRPVTLFATGPGLRALCRDWSGLTGSAHDAVLAGRGVAGLEALREAALLLDVRLLACEAGLLGEGIGQAELLEGVRVAGIASFLADAAGGQLLSF